MTDLNDAIAELRRVTPANDPWDGRDFNSIPAPIDDAICTILNAVVSGELVPALPADLAARDAEIARLREALGMLHHAVCGETGFAQAVRSFSGLYYPWPALDEADMITRAALKGDTHE